MIQYRKKNWEKADVYVVPISKTVEEIKGPSRAATGSCRIQSLQCVLARLAVNSNTLVLPVSVHKCNACCHNLPFLKIDVSVFVKQMHRYRQEEEALCKGTYVS